MSPTPFLQLVRSRTSLRSYDEREISDADILSMAEAARLAPSAENGQPWRFIAVKEPAARDALAKACFSGIFSPTRFASRAPLIFALCAERAGIIEAGKLVLQIAEALTVMGDSAASVVKYTAETIEAAKKAGVEGAVILEPTTDIYGRVRDIKVLRSIPLLDQAAIDAVRQWVYEPPVVDGKPISVTFTVTVRFTLDNSAPSEKVTVVENRAFDGPFITSFMGWRRDDIKKRSPAETDAVWATGAIKPPKRIKTVDPVYPEPARKSGSEGDIILNVETDPAGKVRWVQVMGGPFEFLGYAAVDAVKQWEYEPLIVDGKPRAALFTVTVRFSLK